MDELDVEPETALVNGVVSAIGVVFRCTETTLLNLRCKRSEAPRTETRETDSALARTSQIAITHQRTRESRPASGVSDSVTVCGCASVCEN